MEEKAKSVIDHAQTDKEPVEEEAKEAVDRYDKLDLACAQKQKELEGVQDCVKEYKDALSPVEELLVKAEQTLAEQEPAGADLKKNKEDLETIKVLLDYWEVWSLKANNCGSVFHRFSTRLLCSCFFVVLLFVVVVLRLCCGVVLCCAVLCFC